jgi:hypothetical protein
MLYLAYLDEFGHIGPYVSADDSKYNTHPVFGLAGLVLPYSEVRSFSTYFFQLKNHLLKFELERSGIHPAKWEKKGSTLYTLKNVQNYPELRHATHRLINNITKRNGFLFYVGLEKHRSKESHDSKKLYHSVLKEAIKRIDQECELRKAQFILMLDQQENNVMRGEIVEAASLAMFGDDNRRCLVEPPIQAESHLYQTLQCADWVCGLMGRLSDYWCEADKKPELSEFQKYFATKIKEAQLRSSIRHL